ncbi:MAG: response regulator [Deltaproteobacteria bacterium]|nr:response regulator [Deltaproteobacteria bacterium]
MTQHKGFDGTFKNISLPDLIQMTCLAEMTMTIQVSDRERQGFIFIQNGAVIHAYTGEKLVGEDALYDILSWRRGKFETLIKPWSGAPSIDKNWMFLIIEATRRLDEQDLDENDKGWSEEPSASTLAQLADIDEILGGAGPSEQAPKTKSDGDKMAGLTRVITVDDSALMCKMLKEALESDNTVRVVGTAKNGREALEKIEQLKPDVITLDVNMPVMSGDTTLKYVMITCPCPVIIISGFVKGTPERIFEFLCLGAVDFLFKPREGEDRATLGRRLIKKIKDAAFSKGRGFRRIRQPNLVNKPDLTPVSRKPAEQLAVLAFPAGGYQEIIRLLPQLPPDIKMGLVACLDMDNEFIDIFVDYLNKRSLISIQKAHDRAPLLEGVCYVAPSGFMATVVQTMGSNVIALREKTAATSEMSLNSLLNSAASAYSDRMVGIYLAGRSGNLVEGLSAISARGGQALALTAEPSPSDTCLSADQTLGLISTYDLTDYLISITHRSQS